MRFNGCEKADIFKQKKAIRAKVRLKYLLLVTFIKFTPSNFLAFGAILFSSLIGGRKLVVISISAEVSLQEGGLKAGFALCASIGLF